MMWGAQLPIQALIHSGLVTTHGYIDLGQHYPGDGDNPFQVT